MTARVRLMRWSGNTPSTFDGGAQAGDGNDSTTAGATDRSHALPNLTERAGELLRHRRERKRVFGDDAALFQEPGLDILLELYMPRVGDAGLASTSVAFAVETPVTTALRWIRVLESRGLVTTGADSRDARVRRVGLTIKGRQLMAAYLERL